MSGWDLALQWPWPAIFAGFWALAVLLVLGLCRAAAAGDAHLADLELDDPEPATELINLVAVRADDELLDRLAASPLPELDDGVLERRLAEWKRALA